MVTLITASLFLVALIGGFAMAFIPDVANLKRVIYSVTFGPIAVVLGFVAFEAGAARYPPVLFLIGALFCASYLPFFIGKVLGKPFFEIWQERRDAKLKETFE